MFIAVDGRDALEKARHYRPDLVLSDHMMPNMTGRDLLRALRDDPALRATPVVFLTARAGSEARIESLEAGADDYLTKPFNAGELLARVRNVLRARAQERELAELNRRLEVRVEEQVAALVRGGELQRFLPRALVEGVMSGAVDLSSGDARTTRAKITVLAAEVVGLAELTEMLEPEEHAALVNELLAELSAAAVAHGGTVERLTASGVSVLFGAPIAMPVPEQARAAAAAALTMRRRLRELGAAWRRRGVTAAIELRAAAHTGFCTVGVFGSDVLRSYTAVGTPVTIASLLLEDAAPGQIVLGGTTQALLDGEPDFATAARGTRALRGLARPVESFLLLDVEPSDAPDAKLPRLRDFSFMPR